MRRTGKLSDVNSRKASLATRPVPMGRSDLLVSQSASNPLVYRPQPKRKWQRARPSQANYMTEGLRTITGELYLGKYADQLDRPTAQVRRGFEAKKTIARVAIPLAPLAAPPGMARPSIRAAAGLSPLGAIAAPSRAHGVVIPSLRAPTAAAAIGNSGDNSLVSLGVPRTAYPQQHYNQIRAKLMADAAKQGRLPTVQEMRDAGVASSSYAARAATKGGGGKARASTTTLGINDPGTSNPGGARTRSQTLAGTTPLPSSPTAPQNLSSLGLSSHFQAIAPANLLELAGAHHVTPNTSKPPVYTSNV